MLWILINSHPPEHLASPTINEIKGGVKRSGNNSVRLKKGSKAHKSKIIKVNLVEKVSTTHEWMNFNCSCSIHIQCSSDS